MAAEREIAVLMYHEVREREKYGMDPGSFEAQVRRIRGFAAPAVTPEELEAGGGVAGKAVMITFDDGYATDYTAALPVLLKYGLTGVSFVTTGYVGRQGYLDWDQVRRLKAAGFSVQSHTHSHPLLNLLGDRAVREELRVSRRLLEDRLGAAVSSLALPGGGIDPRIVRIAREEGYRFVFSSIPGINRVSSAFPDVWCRMRVSHRTPADVFEKIVRFDPGTYGRARLMYRLKAVCKRVVGHERYQRLWRRYYS